MPLPHITTSLSGPPRLPLGVSATCFTSRLGVYTSKQPLPIDLFHFLPYSHSMAEMASTHGPHCSSRKPRRSPIRGMCFTLHGIVCVYIPVLLSDTQQLKELNLSNSGLVPQICLGTQQQHKLRAARSENVCSESSLSGKTNFLNILEAPGPGNLLKGFQPWAIYSRTTQL